ncbi:PTS mannose transporter subunit IID [Enterococcus florum]|uniref:PTS mannose transporter subunit IID n=1 Tax=Enterococcus florum TaxID=2480627 RepID=A0A4P5PGU4_9ENTE|nr:PTS system mannose/fructose/sorbose family transporter subunit IID [Enterococcus florum]GCF95651.1 PTS mannose transporter subunit IID [Enterococcus florum]
MENQPLNKEEKHSLLTKKDLNQVFFRSFFENSTINYERFQSLGFLYAMQPILKKLYSNKEDYIRAAKRHLEMYNCTEYMVNPILGVTIALEEKNAALCDKKASSEEFEKSINSMKVGLMGPLAGIGDSLIWATIRPIIAAIGAGIALQGSFLGPLLFLVVFNFFHLGFRYYTLHYAYHKGTALLSNMHESNIIAKLSEGAAVLGLTVLGCLVAQWVSLSISTVLKIQGAEINIQELLDGIMPSLLPLGLTMLLVFLFNKKLTSGKLVIFIFILALVLSLLGV